MKRSEEVHKCIDDKWVPTLEGNHSPIGGMDCFLCNKYAETSCFNCPVSNVTHRPCCHDSPYWEFNELYKNFIRFRNYDLHAEVTAATQWEIDFLNEVEQAELVKELK